MLQWLFFLITVSALPHNLSSDTALDFRRLEIARNGGLLLKYQDPAENTGLARGLNVTWEVCPLQGSVMEVWIEDVPFCPVQNNQNITLQQCSTFSAVLRVTLIMCACLSQRRSVHQRSNTRSIPLTNNQEGEGAKLIGVSIQMPYH